MAPVVRSSSRAPLSTQPSPGSPHTDREPHVAGGGTKGSCQA